jgi:hypothetical protein
VGPAASFDVRGGLLIRQVHHWSADVFVAAVCLRILRTFFRGRISRRALRGWVTLLPLGMLAAYTGTILPDDGLSGGSLSVITGVLESVPLTGTHLVFWIFGGPPPGHEVIVRDYWVHILVLPALCGALLLLSLRPFLLSPRSSPGWPHRVLAGPALAFLMTRVFGHALADRRRDEELHGRETGRIFMNPQGGYFELHEPARRPALPSADPAEARTTDPERRPAP